MSETSPSRKRKLTEEQRQQRAEKQRQERNERERKRKKNLSKEERDKLNEKRRQKYTDPEIKKQRRGHTQKSREKYREDPDKQAQLKEQKRKYVQTKKLINEAAESMEKATSKLKENENSAKELLYWFNLNSKDEPDKPDDVEWFVDMEGIRLSNA